MRHAIDANGVALHVLEQGDPDGRPLVFSNSLGTDLRLWDAVLPHLPGGLRILGYDTRGHGLSACPDGPYGIDDLVRDAAAVLDACDVRDPVFVGLSIGGLTAQALASARPDLVKAAVLSNTASRMGSAEMWQARMQAITEGGLEAISEAVMQRWFPARFRETSEARLWRNMLMRTPQEGYIGCCAALAGADLRAATAALRLPVLGISGSEDGACTPAETAATIATIPGARCEVIDGAGHLPCVDAPEDYAHLLTAFLKEVGHV